MPKGAIQSRTDFGADGYGGPCPPPGDKPHHYQITVFAVDVDKLPDAKNDSASAALVEFDLHFHTLAKATLTGCTAAEHLSFAGWISVSAIRPRAISALLAA
jgi:Raf kinase inhibitor-like YbhB/YbcL family protein